MWGERVCGRGLWERVVPLRMQCVVLKSATVERERDQLYFNSLFHSILSFVIWFGTIFIPHLDTTTENALNSPSVEWNKTLEARRCAVSRDTAEPCWQWSCWGSLQYEHQGTRCSGQSPQLRSHWFSAEGDHSMFSWSQRPFLLFWLLFCYSE